MDYFPLRCDDVYARTLKRSGVHGAGYLGDLDTTETGLLKACLGDADGNATNNADAYDWDDGPFSPQGKPNRMGATPHVAKVRPPSRIRSLDRSTDQSCGARAREGPVLCEGGADAARPRRRKRWDGPSGAPPLHHLAARKWPLN